MGLGSRSTSAPYILESNIPWKAVKAEDSLVLGSIMANILNFGISVLVWKNQTNTES